MIKFEGAAPGSVISIASPAELDGSVPLPLGTQCAIGNLGVAGAGVQDSLTMVVTNGHGLGRSAGGVRILDFGGRLTTFDTRAHNLYRPSFAALSYDGRGRPLVRPLLPGQRYPIAVDGQDEPIGTFGVGDDETSFTVARSPDQAGTDLYLVGMAGQYVEGPLFSRVPWTIHKKVYDGLVASDRSSHWHGGQTSNFSAGRLPEVTNGRSIIRSLLHEAVTIPDPGRRHEARVLGRLAAPHMAQRKRPAVTQPTNPTRTF